MFHSSIALLLTFCFFFSAEVNCLRRTKRETFRVVVSNESLPCQQLSEILARENGGRPPRWIQLNDEEKNRLMRMRGHDFIRSFTGRSFQNAAPVAEPLLPDQFVVSTKTGSRPELRSKILTRLQRFRKIKDLASRSFYDSYDEDWSSSATIPDCKSPSVHPNDVGLNNTTYEDSSGFETTVECCLRRNSQMTIDGVTYKTMCTTCSTTITSPNDDYWPQILYGTICVPGDDKCLYNGDTSSGRCIQTKIWVQMLHRSSDECVLVLQNGQQMMSHAWNQYQYQLSVGCQCAVLEHPSFW